MVRAIVLGAALLFAALPAQACRLALVLAMDVSNSVDAAEDQLQRQGLANALLSPDVKAAFFVSSEPVALLAFEWSGRFHQSVLQDWIDIRDEADLVTVSQRIATSPRAHRDFPTAMGYALGYASTRLSERPDCRAHTIDVAGDGVNNDGFGPAEAYAAFAFDRVTVNGLVVDASLLENRDQLIAYFRHEVLRGPGAFLEVANGFADYEETMKRKLVRELLAQIVGQVDSSPDRPRAAEVFGSAEAALQ